MAKKDIMDQINTLQSKLDLLESIDRIHGTVYPTLYADFNALGYGIFEMKAGGIND